MTSWRVVSVIQWVGCTYFGVHGAEGRLGFGLKARREAMTPFSIRQASEKCMRPQVGHHQLLPGIFDEITLAKISPKLSWKDFYVLALVSRAWLHAIQTREVYDARILSRSPETFVVHRWEEGLFLSSTRDYSRTALPLIPCRGSVVVPLDGKIYVLGGEDEAGLLSNKAFVLDVAGQTQWKECTSMHEPRTRFGCGVIRGKIYVFGGCVSTRIHSEPPQICGSEVYDPKHNLWCPIKPLAGRYNPEVKTVGEELFVHGGRVFDGGYQVPKFWDVYDPVQDEWRVVNRGGGCNLLFVARGKLYSINKTDISIYDAKENCWTQLGSFSFSSITGRPSSLVRLIAVQAVDDELLLGVCFLKPDERTVSSLLLAQSKGFGSGRKEIVWQTVRHGDLPYICRQIIQL